MIVVGAHRGRPWMRILMILVAFSLAFRCPAFFVSLFLWPFTTIMVFLVPAAPITDSFTSLALLLGLVASDRSLSANATHAVWRFVH